MDIRLAVLFCFVIQVVHGTIPSSNICSSAGSSGTCTGSPNCPASASCLNVLWTEFKPYSYMDDSNFVGIIPGIFKELLSECCKSCLWKVNLTSKVTRQTITAGLKVPTHIDVVFPYHSTDGSQVQGMHFVSFVKNPSVVYVTKKQSASAIPRKLIGAVWNAWPVLIMALLLSVVSGVLLWFLELWRNPDEFPHSFFSGSWEGFWWAFVSMTTVGYGDRSPRSILGRAFAIVWIMIGICICSIFTATLTTSLTTITLEDQKTLARAKVGAIRSSLEASTGVNSKAKIINYNSTTDLWRALENENVEGILLDSYFSATTEISDYIENEDYRISQTVEVEDKSYGLLVRDVTLKNCLSTNFEEYETDELAELIAGEIDSESSENEAASRSDSIFNPTGDIFWPSLYACIGVGVVMMIVGLIWEFFIKDKCLKRMKTGSSLVEVKEKTNLDQMEKQMVEDVQKLFADWRAKLEVGIVGPMEVVDVEHNGEQMGMKHSQHQL